MGFGRRALTEFVSLREPFPRHPEPGDQAPAPEHDEAPAPSRLEPDEVDAALASIMEIPRAWIVVMVSLAVVSCVGFNRAAGGGLSVSFAMGTITLGAVALIWLPVLLRVFALGGGSLKALGVEASSEGLLEGLVARLASIKTVADAGRRGDASAGEVAAVANRQVEEVSVDYLSAVNAVDRKAIRDLARSYERLRIDRPTGSDRTTAMTQIVNQAKVRAAANPDRARAWIPNLLGSRNGGERIVGLAFLQEAPLQDAFAEVVGLIEGSATAFEMYHALLALNSLLPLLSSAQREEAAKVLSGEARDPRGVGIGADRMSWIKRLLADLQSD